MPRFFISRCSVREPLWAVIDHWTQLWVRRFASKSEAQAFANMLNAKHAKEENA